MKTKNIIRFLICLSAASALFGVIGCKSQSSVPGGGTNPPAVPTNEAVRLAKEKMENLPDAADFGAADVSALEEALAAYEILSAEEKKEVAYDKAEALLKKAVYLDASTVSFIPQSRDDFVLKPYLTGKKILSVKAGEDDLYYGQYTVNENEVEISSAVLKQYVPSVFNLEITTDVGADYTYRIYAGMQIDELYAVTDGADTELEVNGNDGLEFIAEKEAGYKTLFCFSQYDGTLRYDFNEGRVYNLYLDFTVPERCDEVTLPVYFEGIGGDLCSVGFNGGLPYIESVGEEAEKYATLSYLGNGIYRLYVRFTAEKGCNTLVVGLDGSETSMQMGNVYVYPLCSEPVFEKSSVSYDLSLDVPLVLALSGNGGDVQSVKISNKKIRYSYEKGVLQIPQTVFEGFSTDSSYDVKAETQFGYAVISVTLLDGMPQVTGNDHAFYSADTAEGVTFTFDLKDKAFADVRLNGAVIAEENYTFDGVTLTFARNYLATLYSENKFEMTFRDCRFKLPFTVSTNYIYKSSFAVSSSDSDLEFAPDGVGSIVEEDGTYWARYYNPGQGTVMILRTNTFQLTEGGCYKLSYKMKLGANASVNWWSPVFTGGYDLIYIKQSGKGVLAVDDVYPAGNPLDTVYSIEKSGEHYNVSLVFTARGKDTPLKKFEFASWGGAAEVYFADIAIEKYSEKTDVLLLGSDLLASGYWGTYKKDISLYTVANRAKIGNTIDACAEQLDTVKTEYTPRKIVLSIGENDVYAGGDVNEIKTKYSKLIKKIKNTYPSSKLYVLSIIKTKIYKNYYPQIETLNAALQADARTKSYQYVDISYATEKDGILDESLFLSDGVHVSRSNYAVITDAIKAGCMLDGRLDALFIGDSYMSVGYWNSYEKDMASIDSVNLGVGGTQTAYWEEKISYLQKSYAAETIVVHIGVNDIDDGGAEAATAIRRIKTLLDHLHEAFPQSRIIWMTISPNKMFESKNYIYPPVNEALTEYADENDWLGVIDGAKHFTGEDGKYLEEYYLSDGMHLNSLGYELFVAEIKKALGM